MIHSRKTLSFAVALLAIFTLSTGAFAGGYNLAGTGPRALAMSGAFHAVADDWSAGYWNPGAMAFNRKTQLASMYSKWLAEIFDDIYYFHLAGNRYYDDIGNLGVNLTYMSYGEQERTVMKEIRRELSEVLTFRLVPVMLIKPVKDWGLV